MKGLFLLLLVFIIIVSLTACTVDRVAIEENVTTEENVEGDNVLEALLKDEVKGYTYLHRSTSKGGNDREQYIWEVLRLSLEATVEDYGSYELRAVEGINQAREDVELIHDTGVITVISDSLNEDNLKDLNRISFPLLRNLLGYRVFFITEDRQEEFDNVKDAEALKPYVFGIGLGWNDKIILEHAGYKVYESNEYKTLYRSLTSMHFDIFSRGVNEVLGEYETYKAIYPELHIEDNVLLYYPLPRYFWFSQSDHGQMLKKRVEIGIDRIIEDGSFYELFDKYFAEGLKELNLKERILIELENPVYSESFDKEDSPYRYNPLE